MIARVRRILADQSGDFMASNMVGSILNLLVLSGLAVGLMSTSTLQTTIALKTQVTNQANTTDTALRSDVLWASGITTFTPDEVQLTTPGTNNQCRESTWELVDDTDGTRDLVNTVVTFSDYDSTTSPVRCTGTRNAAATQVMATQVSAGTTFTYANHAGRSFTDATTGTLTAGPAPAGVDVLRWKSSTVAAVRLDTTIGDGRKVEAPFTFFQSAPSLERGVAQIDASEHHFMDHGSLTEDY